ncbi:hypothetical protein AX15_005164 [Amanita polypyramis BW_CC]|nr:hypothetical protein AX15_005164 [Amanita polypyramis BW_CC]
MSAVLLAPEFILPSALGDWTEGTECLVRMIEIYPTCGWTETHALFAYMGGFQLVNEDGSRKQLRMKEFFDSVIDGVIDIPKISIEEIQDRSKGDGIAKAIVVVQTLWFALQVINRAGHQLPVTKLELTTLAHVSLNIIIYWCWWNKPLNVRFSIDVYPKTPVEKENSVADDVSPRTDECNSSQEGCPDNEPDRLLDVVIEDGELIEKTQLTDDTQPEEVEEGDETNEAALRSCSTEKRADDRTTFDYVLGAEDKELQQVTFRFSFRVRIGSCCRNVDASWAALLVGPPICALSGVFGAIHCLAWNSTFATHVESTLWRISAVIVTVTPTVFFALMTGYIAYMRGLKADEFGKKVAVPSLIISLAYIFGRVCLLVLAFISLRALPEKAYLVPSWTLYIPHIG